VERRCPWVNMNWNRNEETCSDPPTTSLRPVIPSSAPDWIIWDEFIPINPDDLV
jgi:hypothetical protein